MSTKANYFKVGVFILSALTITVLAIVVLSGGKWFKKIVYWESYFDESVQGLAVGAPIKYRGVQVGTVEAVEFVGDVYGQELSTETRLRYGRYVRVIGSATDVTPHLSQEEQETALASSIVAGLRVRLTSQGVTGVVYVEADYFDPKVYPAMEVPWAPHYQYMPSAPSTVTVLGAALQNIARDLEKTDVHTVIRDFDSLVLEMTKLVKETNVQVLSNQTGQVLAELQGFAQQARRLVESREFKTFISDGAHTAEGARDLIMELSQTSKQIRIASDKFPDASLRLERSLRRVDTLLANKSQDVEDTIENLRVTSENLRELTDNAKRYPAQLLLGEPPPRAGSTKR